MFERRGVSEAVLRASNLPPAIVMLDALDGMEIARIQTGDSFRRRFKHPYIAVHRIDLHHVLLDACKTLANVELEASTSAVGIDDEGDQVRVRTKDGRGIAGAAVIGADGLGSCIRSMPLNGGPPRPIRYREQRTSVPLAGVPAG